MKPTLILEMQDGMMCKNSKSVVKDMIDAAINNISSNINLIFKWQLYTKIKTYVEIIPLKHEIFEFAYQYAALLGYKTTASVFDQESLNYLQKFNVPFIKIACKTDLYDFRKNMWSLDGNFKTVISVENKNDFATMAASGSLLCCIPKYPAMISEYESEFGELLYYGISDHTVGLDLYNKYMPVLYEKHFYMDGLDSWDKDWAIKPEELQKL
jgi:sialic acid synthase SpsE